MERRLRLREEADVRAARARGKSYADGPLVARIRPNDLQPPQNRYTVVAGKRSGNAVKRNRLKRLVREALRHIHPTLRPGHDIVVIVRGDSDELPNYATASTCIERIVARARLVTDESVASRQSPAESKSQFQQTDPSHSSVQRDNTRLTTDD